VADVLDATRLPRDASWPQRRQALGALRQVAEYVDVDGVLRLERDRRAAWRHLRELRVAIARRLGGDVPPFDDPLAGESVTAPRPAGR
jgi:hypothetical protein